MRRLLVVVSCASALACASPPPPTSSPTAPPPATATPTSTSTSTATATPTSTATATAGADASAPPALVAPPSKLGAVRDVGSCSGRPRAGLRVAAADASCAAFRDLGMPGAQMRSAGLDVAAIDSADAFRAAYGCAPPLRVDFARERVAVVTTSHAMNVGMQIVAARGDARRGTIRIASTYGCTGIPPPQMTEVLFVVLPASSSAIDVETCGVPRPPCGPVP